MRKLIEELVKEANTFDRKSIAQLESGYRKRTKFERVLFRLAKVIANIKFEYDLGGLSYAHQQSFFQYAYTVRGHETELEVMTELFEISNILFEISSSDPYLVDSAIRKLGGKLKDAHKDLNRRVQDLARTLSTLL